MSGDEKEWKGQELLKRLEAKRGVVNVGLERLRMISPTYEPIHRLTTLELLLNLHVMEPAIYDVCVENGELVVATSDDDQACDGFKYPSGVRAVLDVLEERMGWPRRRSK